MWFSRLRRRQDEPQGSANTPGSQGFTAPFGLAYTRHAQPDPGIAAYSYDALALPLYTPIGPSNRNRRQFTSAPSNPVVMQLQGVQITTVGNPGYLAGQFVSGPLLDTTSNSGMMMAAAIPAPGSFMIPQGGMP